MYIASEPEGPSIVLNQPLANVVVVIKPEFRSTTTSPGLVVRAIGDLWYAYTSELLTPGAPSDALKSLVRESLNVAILL